MQNVVLHKFHIPYDNTFAILEELDLIFDFEILAKKDGVGTIPQPGCVQE